ncbi:carboxypeptidase regulatory-like domain-containing protein [Aeromicrobium sp. CFBP 8757]|uniref:carboxypeptidase-like regulatory domain-containing protein n=1 Tax=Aeromicrobium sp. CFBP 8757 TaxID=2775288 RepID=UPI00177E36E1|nr:carboxypeptidase-like regulatory domain-containing protein [Aeromicrobium sp. CFBP 8757]MBD8605612.1 carboxypeptidase regulatory-like domain-containing protein [Aeromicrobium sp. CFBP 8757]
MTRSARLTSSSHPRHGRRPRRIAGTLTALCLGITGLAALPAQAAGAGSITGTVFTQAVGGTPQAATGGYVYLSKKSADGDFYTSVDSDPSTAGTDGFSFSGSTFTLSGLEPGSYKFEMASASAQDGGDYQREYYNDAEYEWDATPVEVGSGETSVDPMVLEPAGQISGRVTDASGAPLANANVSFQRTALGGSNGVQTDADGRYSTTNIFGEGLVKGDVRVTASKSGTWETDEPSYVSEYWKDARTYAAATPVKVVPGATTKGVDFTLDVAPRIRLTVKDPEGQPVPNADVGIFVFYDGAWGPYQAGPNLTDGSGVFRKTVAVGEKYKFFIDPPEGVGGVTEWYDDAYSEADAKVVSATEDGQVVDITIKLGAAPAVTPAPAPAPTPTVVPAPVAPGRFATSKVSVQGTAKVGRTLRASTRAWAPSPVSLSYTWYRNGRVVKGQKKAAYTLRKADQGKRITVRVHQRKASYTTASRLSAKTPKVRKR